MSIPGFNDIPDRTGPFVMEFHRSGPGLAFILAAYDIGGQFCIPDIMRVTIPPEGRSFPVVGKGKDEGPFSGADQCAFRPDHEFGSSRKDRGSGPCFPTVRTGQTSDGVHREYAAVLQGDKWTVLRQVQSADPFGQPETVADDLTPAQVHGIFMVVNHRLRPSFE